MALLDRILAKRGLQRADLMKGRKKFNKFMRRDGVPASEELSRVLGLPRSEPTHPDLVDLLTAHLAKTDSVRLWEHQALMLMYAHDLGGAFGSLPVGTGKTLISMLLATLLESKRPVLMIPKQLEDKTLRDYDKISEDWKATLPTILGYELLSHPMHDEDLEKLNPDLLILDEGDRAGRRSGVKSALHRKVEKFVSTHPECTVVVMSAELEGAQLLRYQGILKWCLGEKQMPLPKSYHETQIWGQAVDHDVPLGMRLDFGALTAFGDDPKKGLSNHIANTPGIVRVLESSCAAPLYIRKWRPKVPDEIESALSLINEEGRRPADGEELEEWELYSVLTQTVLGFNYVPDPLPPKEWINARRAWNRCIRQALEEEIPGIHSPSQVTAAVRTEELPGIGILDRWEQIAAKHNIGKKTIWFSKDVIRQALAEARKHKDCVIWSRFRAVGEALESMGITHYSKKGRDSEGNHIEDASGVISASIKSCSVGVNLQQWSEAIVLTPPSSCGPWEQIVGRHHRAGQLAENVTFRTILAIPQHQNALSSALAEAKHITKMSGSEKKLVLAKIG